MPAFPLFERAIRLASYAIACVMDALKAWEVAVPAEPVNPVRNARRLSCSAVYSLCKHVGADLKPDIWAISLCQCKVSSHMWFEWKRSTISSAAPPKPSTNVKQETPDNRLMCESKMSGSCGWRREANNTNGFYATQAMPALRSNCERNLKRYMHAFKALSLPDVHLLTGQCKQKVHDLGAGNAMQQGALLTPWWKENQYNYLPQKDERMIFFRIAGHHRTSIIK